MLARPQVLGKLCVEAADALHGDNHNTVLLRSLVPQILDQAGIQTKTCITSLCRRGLGGLVFRSSWQSQQHAAGHVTSGTY